MGQTESVGYAETKNIEHVAVLIGHFHAPGALVRFSQLYDAVGGPLGRIEPEPGLSAELIPVKPAMVNQRGLRNGIERCEAADLSGGYREGDCRWDGSHVFDFLAHGRLVQYQFLKGMIGWCSLFGDFRSVL